MLGYCRVHDSGRDSATPRWPRLWALGSGLWALGSGAASGAIKTQAARASAKGRAGQLQREAASLLICH